MAMTPLALSVAIMDLVKEAKAMSPSREVRLTITKLQEAYLWLSELMSNEEDPVSLTRIGEMPGKEPAP